LRDGFLPEEKDRGPLHKKRAAILAVSLAVHALIVLGLYHARMTVKILPFGEEVRSVRLAPPPPMLFPGRIEDYIRTHPSPGAFEPGKPPRERRPDAPSGEPSGAPKGGDAGRGSGLVPGNLMKDLPGAPPASGGSQIGSFALSSRDLEEEDGKLRINLLAIPDHVQDAPMGFEGGVPSGRSFRRYTLPGLASSRGGSRGSGTGGGGPGGGQRASAVFQSPGYDISPWAAKVIERVQTNWSIPSGPNVTGRSEVRIAVTIEKSGAFSAFEVTDLADLEVFNAAAAAALRASEPLPTLPDDFPASNLSAIFVFAYHD
jgi:TonB C terminal